MKPLSIGRAWEETVVFIKREGGLLFPVAFVFLALPPVIFQQLIPASVTDCLRQMGDRKTAILAFQAIPPGFWLGFALMVAISVIGVLAIYALAVRPGISVGEAMKLGLQRLPVLIGAGLLVTMGGGAVVIVLTVLAGLISIVVGMAAVTALLTVVVFAALGFVGVRLFLLNAVVIDRPVTPLDAVRQSWALTRGQFWRLAGFIIVLVFLVTIVQTATQSVFGVIGGLVGGPDIAVLVAGLATAALSAVIQVYVMVMTARIYRQLEGTA
ncbi:hypothetical protein C1T17_07600 [Sphingobium sp. SCG-1]|uniref:hypothetical protein n=1 Tax=Sphingobium sp. SCG-1 TaxID=2072936 RepID=UPI000CD67A21|nr:hypothetical protein [Sphingobium sp. SCG-1]AUW57990.1 hypothetical protein C1T17_07600 [Sphingobium sp. SCG-1]